MGELTRALQGFGNQLASLSEVWQRRDEIKRQQKLDAERLMRELEDRELGREDRLRTIAQQEEDRKIRASDRQLAEQDRTENKQFRTFSTIGEGAQVPEAILPQLGEWKNLMQVVPQAPDPEMGHLIKNELLGNVMFEKPMDPASRFALEQAQQAPVLREKWRAEDRANHLADVAAGNAQQEKMLERSNAFITGRMQDRTTMTPNQLANLRLGIRQKAVAQANAELNAGVIPGGSKGYPARVTQLETELSLDFPQLLMTPDGLQTPTQTPTVPPSGGDAVDRFMSSGKFIDRRKR